MSTKPTLNFDDITNAVIKQLHEENFIRSDFEEGADKNMARQPADARIADLKVMIMERFARKSELLKFSSNRFHSAITHLKFDGEPGFRTLGMLDIADERRLVEIIDTAIENALGQQVEGKGFQSRISKESGKGARENLLS